MGTMLNGDSRRMYSWWWDSHNSPKNSKWLQENLTDMDTNVKAMIKLIEEDADSFARRAEMYYKKRPELLKLVEEFYRAYRALAERYNHATGALRQAQRTMAEAFPNQMPLVSVDDSPSASSGSEVGPHTPEMPSPMRAFYDPDSLHKDTSGVSSNLHTISRNGAYSEENDALYHRKGLKQLNEMFAAGEGTARAKFLEGKVRKGLTFEEEDGKSFEGKIHNGPTEEEDFKDEMKRLKEDISRLLTDNQNLKNHCTSESENAENLKDALSKLESEKKAASLQHQLSQERISNLETEISSMKDKIEKLNNEMAAGNLKLNCSEEQCLVLEKVNQSLQLELEKSVQKIKVQQQELEQSKKELESLQNSMQEQQLKANLLCLEIQTGVEKLKGMELSKVGLEEESCKLKEMNGFLKEENLSCALKLNVLQDEMISLKETKVRLEDEVELHVVENEGLKQELYSVKDERRHLEQKHKGLVQRMEAVSLNVESLESSIKELQNEKMLLLENLKNMEIVSEKNAALEISLSDTNYELEGLREKANMLEESRKTLHDKIAVSVTEKAMLVAQLDIVSQNMGMLLEKNTLLENSLSDVNTELEHLREGMKCLENSCQSLNDQISNLLAEKHTLLSQVESFKLSVENMEGNYLEAEEKNLNLKREKDSMVHQIMELEHSLRLEKKEHEVLLLAIKSQLASLEIELHLLQEKSQDREEKLEVEQQKCMGGMLENFILKRCLCDMEEKNLIISKECLKLLEASRSAEKLISELEHKDLVQKKKIMLLLDHYEKPREGVLALSKALNIVEYGRNGNGIKDEMLLQIVLGEVRNLQDSKLDVQDENLRLDLEIVVLGTLIQQIGLEKLHLYRELDNRTSDVLVLQTTKHELIEMNEQLRQDVKASYERENIWKAEMRILRQQLSDSYEVHQKSQIEVSRLLEENHSLYDQNLNLLAEKNNLISQVEYIREAVESLESTCEVLEYKHLSLQIERDSVIHQMLELEGFLRRGRLEHDALLLSNKSQVVILENQIQILQENLVVKDEEFEVKQQETMNALLEIFILQRCLFDMKDKSSVLSRESQKHLEASRSAEIIISQLEQRDTIQNRKITLLSDNNNKLKEGILLLLKELSINMECQTSDGITDEILLQTILGEIKNLSKSKSDAQDGCEHLRLEMSIFVSLLKQIGVEKKFLYVELQGLSKELIILQSEKHEMMEMVKQLQQNLHISNQREQVLEAEIEKLCGKFSNLCAAHQTSQAEVSKLLEENGLLSKKFCNLRKSKEALEEENSEVLAEAMLLDHLYLLFRSICAERAVDLKVLTDNLGCVSAVKDDLNEEIRVQNEKMRILKEENNHLKESVTNLEECRSCLLVLEFELNLARKFGDELNFQMEREKDLFIQKEMELSVAQNKNMELCRELECIKKDMDGAKVVREELENKILILSEENASGNKEISHIREANKLLHEDLGRLNGEVEVLKRRGEHLSFELQKETVAIGQCEGEAITLLNDIQTSTVIAAVLEEKLLEQIVAYESLMMSSILHREIWAEEIAVSNACACELKKKLGELEGENRSLHADLVACFPLVMSLRDSIASLEEHTLLFSSLQERQDECLISHQTEQIKEDRDTAKAGFSELQRLISKVEVLQKVIRNTASLFMQERLDSSANLEAARKEIEELKLKQSSGHRNSKEKYGQAMKDIQLDKVSSSLAHRPRRVETSELDDQMLELWETAERDDIEAVIEEEKSEHPSSELVSEREPSVDKLEISTKANESPREWKRSVIERISSDTRRLSILQTSMKQLKTKMENSEKKKHPKGLEYDTVKVQLREAEQAIFEQTNINGTLKQKVREKFESSNGATEERRQISEQARRGSEKIGKLELELQKIEYILLKIEEETENKRARVGDRTSVLLREYLHGRRDGRGRRKGRFCGCVRPKTEG